MRLLRRAALVGGLATAALTVLALPAGAQEPAPIDSGNTAWILVSAALVMFMTPGLAFFYGGLVRPKNVLSTIMHCFMALGIVSVLWVVIGHTLAFGPDMLKQIGDGGLIGGLDYLGFKDVGEQAFGALNIPHSTFAIYQMMFAVITPALIAGHVRGAHQVHVLPGVHCDLGGRCLRTARALGVGRRLPRALRPRRARLRRRHGRSPERWCGRSRGGDLPRQAQGLPGGPVDGSAQRAVRGSRRVDPVVRLVRLQRWECARGRRIRVARVHEHPRRYRRCDLRLAHP